MDWIGLDCALDWIVHWIVDWIGLWIGLDCGLDWIELWIGLCGNMDDVYGGGGVDRDPDIINP